ncbi:LLM class flavin-dependent oxidoreductase [Conexibacter stalactiti]|uniref:LLM class flavin-dependent oxidoreductase n=1 Tax=Conexibacter stalactiti TaxID=1940611 RepID=A0ABU4HL44_9ACTN|nr:LLM class flavin-dependent oxidoreductase [Conexibacter stalactiti]MDW5593422.1 LLM class flavin-dependent oxidoreductase [Conexibacter stalactiti]MEC5034063.1 LLM class flavin-dependent oxidoreductase [Conexibacter stalactiti]
MDLGIFLPSATGGFAMTTAVPTRPPTWELSLDVTKRAEQLGFAFALSMVKHRGFGGEMGFWNEALDSFTLMAGLARETERITLIPSVPVLAIHPALTARQAVTVDQLAEGRFALNIVTGWYRSEYAQWSMWPGDQHYSRRYDYATEYVTILQELWETGRSSFKGEYFTLDDAQCLPLPPRRIPIVCAGRSERGMRFTAELGDYNFVVGSPEQLPEMKQRLDAEAAASGRDVRTLALFMIVAAETEEAARRRYRELLARADTAAIATMRRDMSMDAAGGAAASALEVEKSLFMGQTPLIGSYERIAEQLCALRDENLMAGCMLAFPDYVDDLQAFGERVVPLLGEPAPGATAPSA